MRGLFLDASDSLADVFDRMVQPGRPADCRQPSTTSGDRLKRLPSLLDGYDFLLDDHSFLPTEALRQLPVA